MFLNTEKGLMLVIALTLFYICPAQTNLLNNGNFEEFEIDTAVYSFSGSSSGQFQLNDTALGWNFGNRVMMSVISRYWSFPFNEFKANTTYYSDSGYAHGGKAFASITPYLADQSGNVHADNLVGLMCRPMQKGHVYKVSFYLKFLMGNCFTSQVSAGFAKDYVYTHYALDKTELKADTCHVPVVKAWSLPGIADNSKYILCSFDYKALGNENYIYIGNFNPGYFKKGTWKKKPVPTTRQNLQLQVRYAIDDLQVIPMDSTERCPPANVQIKISTKQQTLPDTLCAGTIYFDTNDSVSQTKDLKDLTVKIDSLDAYTSVLVLGFTDNEGSMQYNQQLSLSRAQAAAQYIKARTGKNVIAQGMGVSHTSTNKLLNRRAVIYLLKK